MISAPISAIRRVTVGSERYCEKSSTRIPSRIVETSFTYPVLTGGGNIRPHGHNTAIAVETNQDATVGARREIGKRS
jgi:hypothetical protein